MTTPTIGFGEYSMWTQKKYDYDWYEWCVYVDEDESRLAEIQCVTYTMDPSFPNPIRRIDDPRDRFALYSAGWGGFWVAAEVKFADGTLSTTGHLLSLRNEWPRGETSPRLDDPKALRVFEALHHDKFRWRKLTTVVRNAGVGRAEALRLLSDLETRNTVRKAYFHSVDGDELWGATDVVGLAPRVP